MMTFPLPFLTRLFCSSLVLGLLELHSLLTCVEVLFDETVVMSMGVWWSRVFEVVTASSDNAGDSGSWRENMSSSLSSIALPAVAAYAMRSSSSLCSESLTKCCLQLCLPCTEPGSLRKNNYQVVTTWFQTLFWNVLVWKGAWNKAPYMTIDVISNPAMAYVL